MVFFKIKKALINSKKRSLEKRLKSEEEKASKRIILREKEAELRKIKKAIRGAKSKGLSPSTVKKAKAKINALASVGRGLGVGFVQAKKTVKLLEKSATKAKRRQTKRRVVKKVKRRKK